MLSVFEFLVQSVCVLLCVIVSWFIFCNIFSLQLVLVSFSPLISVVLSNSKNSSLESMKSESSTLNRKETKQFKSRKCLAAWVYITIISTSVKVPSMPSDVKSFV